MINLRWLFAIPLAMRVARRDVACDGFERAR